MRPEAASIGSPDPIVPFPARRAMQVALWEQGLRPGRELTTWTDAVGLAEITAEALRAAGWRAVPMDHLGPSELGSAPGPVSVLTWRDEASRALIYRVMVPDECFEAAWADFDAAESEGVTAAHETGSAAEVVMALAELVTRMERAWDGGRRWG